MDNGKCLRCNCFSDLKNHLLQESLCHACNKSLFFNADYFAFYFELEIYRLQCISS